MRLLILWILFVFSVARARMPDFKQPVLGAMHDVKVLVGQWQGRGYRLETESIR